MFLRACVRVFCLDTCWKKYFADAILAVNNNGVHQPLKSTKATVQCDAIVNITSCITTIQDSSSFASYNISLFIHLPFLIQFWDGGICISAGNKNLENQYYKNKFVCDFYIIAFEWLDQIQVNWSHHKEI